MLRIMLEGTKTEGVWKTRINLETNELGRDYVKA